VSLVAPFPLLLFGSGFGLMLTVRACSLELSLCIVLHITQHDLEVVKPEVGAGFFLLGFLLTLSRVSPSRCCLSELVFYPRHLLREMDHRHYTSSQVV
jgi:hypothetical protein